MEISVHSICAAVRLVPGWDGGMSGSGRELCFLISKYTTHWKILFMSDFGYRNLNQKYNQDISQFYGLKSGARYRDQNILF